MSKPDTSYEFANITEPGLNLQRFKGESSPIPECFPATTHNVAKTRQKTHSFLIAHRQIYSGMT